MTITTTQAKLVAIIPSQCVLGEGPVWDERRQVLWFTDIQNAQLLRLDWETGELERFNMPERVGAVGLTADPDTLVCAFASGFALFDAQVGASRWLHRTHEYQEGIRMNDGRVDRQGRFWAGSMVEDNEKAQGQMGVLYRLDEAGAPPVRIFDGISISNSIAFSPNGEHFYFADTPTQKIVRYDIEGKDGSVRRKQDFAQINGKGFPDGSDVDAAGFLWNAEWGTGRVTAYAPDGRIHRQIDLPVTQATCVAFGGPDHDLIFVTTASEGLSETERAQQPHAGDVFVFRSGVTGLAAPTWAGELYPSVTH